MPRLAIINIAAGTLLLVGLAACSSTSSGSDACSEADCRQPSPDELVQEGKAALEAGNYFLALARFDEVLETEPENTDALYGRVLADLQRWLGLADMLLSFSIGVNDPYSSPLETSIDSPLTMGTGETLAGDLLAMGEDQIQRLHRLMQSKDVTFRLDRFPVMLGGTILMDLGSEWDLADVFMLDALTQSLVAILALLDSQEWKDDEVSPEILEVLEAEDQPPLTLLLAGLLNEHQDFLKLKPDGVGQQCFARARDALATSANDILVAYGLMEQETDGQENDVLTIGPTVEGVEHLQLQGTFYRPGREPLDQLPVLWAGKKYGLRLSAEQMASNLKGEVGTRIRLEHDVLAPVGMLLDLFRQTMTIKGFIESTEGLLSQVGAEIEPELIGLLDTMQASTAEDLPGTFVALLTVALFDPSALELDTGAFLSRPVGFRLLLPNWDQGGGDGEADVFYEFECARLGWRDLQLGTKEASLVLDDPFLVPLGSELPEVDVRVLQDGGDEPIVVDVETVKMNTVDGRPGRFEVVVMLSPVETGQQGNGILEGTDKANRVTATYVEGSDAETPFEITAAYLEDRTTDRVWAEDMSCQPETARDTAHFTDITGSFLILPDTGEANLAPGFTPMKPDGYPAEGIYLAFRSGSLNNLLWVDLDAIKPTGWDPEENGFPASLARTDAAALNLLLFFSL